MKVFKFGGAATNSYERIKGISYILGNYPGEKILIVISAMGKMTNALEKVAKAFNEAQNDEALQLFQKIKDYHLNQLKYLVTLQWEKATNQLNDFFTEVEWLLHDKPVKDPDYYYDQIVSIGELLSSSLISFFLQEEKIPNQWIDVRDLLKTDDNFRDAKLDWDFSRKNVAGKLIPLFEQNDIVVTQGFIASTGENESTTFGREGSDYTAAIFGELLEAESVTIWKDVNGVMNADPKEFPEAQTLEELSYKEVIEMAYYGAQVIHPKTIKPLQNKNIPLFVKPFLDLRLTGTVISSKQNHHIPPVLVYKRNQALVTLQTIDFSFVEGKPVNLLYEMLRDLRIKPNLSQNGAISLMICIDDIPEKTEELAIRASSFFNVSIQKGLTLLSIRHYTDEYLQQGYRSEIIMEQRNANTLQRLIRM